MAQAVEQGHGERQLRFFEMPARAERGQGDAALAGRSLDDLGRSLAKLCAGCRAREARYGFREDGSDNPLAERPRTLCFECFRVEIVRRQAISARLARGWNAKQVQLPLDERMRTLSLRRRRAQIAARKALGLT